MQNVKISKKRAKLLSELEAIVGGNCYNSSMQNWGAGGVFMGEGRDFRYPLTLIDEGGDVQKTRFKANPEDPQKLITGYYAFGANELLIMAALNEVLVYLEENHNLKI